MPVPHLPILRKGQPYKSLDVVKWSTTGRVSRSRT